MTQQLMTIAEAAAALHVSEQRVHQLLREGAIESAPLAEGRLRHKAGAARVVSASVTQLVSNRAARKVATRDQPAELRRQVIGISHAEKVEIDLLREEVRAERSRNRRLIDVAATLVDLLRDTTDSADRLDAVTGKYSDALTQLMSPEDASELLDGDRS